MSKSRLFSGKIKKATGADLSDTRSEFIDVANAEPDLGIASSDNYLLVGNQDGTRTWTDPLGITVGNATNAVNTIISVPGDNSINIYTTGTTGTVTIALNTSTLMKTATTLVNNANVTLGNVTFTGNVVFNNTTTYVASTNTVFTDNIIEIHNSGTSVNNTWAFDDGKDIGFRFHYYNGGDRNAALVLANDTKYLEFYNTGTESITGAFISGSYGTFKTGSIKLAATTSTNSTNTGALTVAGGVGVGGSIYVGGVVTATTFIGALTGTASTATNAATAYSTVAVHTAGTGLSGSTFNGSTAQTWTLNTSTLMQNAVNLSGGTVNATTGQFSGRVVITNTSSTNSTQTGALVVTGGLAVGGGGYFGGVVTATNISIGGASFNFASIFNGFNSTDDVNVYGGNINVVSVTTTTVQALAVFTGYLASVNIGWWDGGNTYQNAMNVTSVATGTILLNMAVTGTYITTPPGNSIRRQLSGTTGGVGWYQLNNTTGYTNNSPSPSFTITGRLNTGTLYTYGGTVTAVSFVGTTVTNAVSTITGGLILTGGAGIGRDVWVGGMVTATSVYDAGSRVLTSVNATAGTGISITGVDNLAPVTGFTINNTGVTSLTAGSNITVSSNTGSVTLSFNNTSGYITTASANTLIANSLTNYTTTASVNTLIANSLTNYTTSATVRTIIANSLTNYTTTASVNTLIANSLTGYLTTVTPVAGTGISITGVDALAPATSFTINNTGVTSLTGTTALGVSSNTGSVTLTNLGVTSLTAGSNITLSASTGSVTISMTTASSILYLTSSTFNTATVFTSSTQATSTNTGALQVRGGLGVGGNIYAGAVYDSGARVWTTATLTSNNQLTNGAGYITTASANTLIANSLTNYLTAVTPTAGTGISITAVDNTAPSTSFTINNTGVTSIAAGTGITVSTSTGTVTISSAVTGVTQSISTWTPTLVFATTQGTQTYTTRIGNYIKHGNLVQAFFSIAISNLGTAAGNLSIGGLPFVSTNTTGVVGSLSIDTQQNMGTVFYSAMKGSVLASSSTVAVFGLFETSPSSGGLTYQAVGAATLINTTSLTGSITYISA